MNVIYQLHDVSGNGYNGNTSSALQFATGVNGKEGEAIVVNPALGMTLTIPIPDEVAGSILTMAFYVFPFTGSSGVIFEFGQFQIIHAFPNKFVSISHIAVIYIDEEVIRCNVVRHEEWTFFAVTFDSFEGKMQLWRNGEIACMANTIFSNITFESPMVFGSQSVHFKIAKLQVYDRPLDEAEMHLAKDRHIDTLNKECRPWPHLFQKLTSSGNIASSMISSSTAQSPITCAHRCRQNKKCFIFSYEKEIKRCQEFTDLSHIEVESKSIPLYYKEV
ncbi:uncharacterized protein LOC117105826 [Anneissia japonica]|uniref:uncharacterized protein LOC117105826 n=1 Tax=Anneissia japonica TaxID=1529436 RepID=UPI0014255FE1|nr:uncharacterized protein LOC117105826 [Anneissia japonica]